MCAIYIFILLLDTVFKIPYKENNQTVTSIKVQLLQHFSEFNFCKVHDYSILCFIFHATLLQIPFLGLMSLTKCLMLYNFSILVATLSHHDFKSWYELSSTFAKWYPPEWQLQLSPNK